MTIISTFSKRQKVLRQEVPDVHYYDKIPTELRVQIVHVVPPAKLDTWGRV